MDVQELEVIPVAHREPPLRNSWGAHSELAARTIVRVTTSNGAVGIGETYGDSEIINGLERAKPIVEESSIYDLNTIRFQLQDDMVFGAIETALLDIQGKVSGQPVHAILGGAIRDEVKYSGYLFYKHADSNPESAAIAPGEVMTPKAMVDEAREFVDTYGFETLKLKGGVLPPEQEIQTLELLAKEFGTDVPLRIDPNGAWSVETAIDICHQLRKLDANIQFLEDPVPTMNAHTRLKRHIDYPIATNMFVVNGDEIAPAIRGNAVDIILSDHHYWGGLTGNIQLDHVADAFDLGIGMHSNSHLGVSMAAMTHVAAAMPTIRYACDTHYPWMADDVIMDPPVEITAGTIDVPDDPGLGVELDDDRLERMHERYQQEETLGYSSVESMAAEYADAMADIGDSRHVPNKPIW